MQQQDWRPQLYRAWHMHISLGMGHGMAAVTQGYLLMWEWCQRLWLGSADQELTVFPQNFTQSLWRACRFLTVCRAVSDGLTETNILWSGTARSPPKPQPPTPASYEARTGSGFGAAENGRMSTVAPTSVLSFVCFE